MKEIFWNIHSLSRLPKKQANAEQRMNIFKTKLSQHKAISAFTSTSIIPVIAIEPDFIKAFDIQIIQGLNFVEGEWKDWQHVLLNESAEQLLGLLKPEDAILSEIIEQNTRKKYGITEIIQK